LRAARDNTRLRQAGQSVAVRRGVTKLCPQSRHARVTVTTKAIRGGRAVMV
jgi:hypothetical protein